MATLSDQFGIAFDQFAWANGGAALQPGVALAIPNVTVLTKAADCFATYSPPQDHADPWLPTCSGPSPRGWAS